MLVGAAAASAHDIDVHTGKDVIKDIGSEGDGIWNVHLDTSMKGTELHVVDRGGCVAKIKVSNLMGTSVTIPSGDLDSGEFVPEHVIRLNSLKLGKTTFTVTVDGDDSVDCTENFPYPFEINVSEDPVAIEKVATKRVRPFLRGFGRELIVDEKALLGTIRVTIDGVKDGNTTAVDGYWGLSNQILDGLFTKRRTTIEELTELRDGFNTVIDEGSFPAGCAPGGLTRGGYGAWD